MTTAADPSRERWNRRWAGERAHASSAPSEFLVAETEALPPGRALDVACGAGRNAVWLARRGWRVTGVDFSDVALRAARELAASAGVEVEWIEADAVTWIPPRRAYDLVTVMYLQLPAPERRAALGHAADAVGPGGTLLVVGHDLLNLTEGWGGPTQAEVLFTPEVDPYGYLREVLTKLPSLTNHQIKDWTPAAYARRLRQEQRLAVAS